MAATCSWKLPVVREIEQVDFRLHSIPLSRHNSFSNAPVELEPKFGQIIHKRTPTYCNTATPRLQWSLSQNLVKLCTRQSLHTTIQLLQGSSGARAKTWPNYTQDNAYIQQHSYSQTSVELEPKFGQIIHKTKPTLYNRATPRLQWS